MSTGFWLPFTFGPRGKISSSWSKGEQTVACASRRPERELTELRSFETTEAMFAYGNSKYHEDLVSKVIELGVTPFEAFTSQDDQQELEDFRNTEQAIHFAL
jgi:hypothetical protein